ncbi:unnamed protein product, partial [Vitis vinifera]
MYIHMLQINYIAVVSLYPPLLISPFSVFTITGVVLKGDDPLTPRSLHCFFSSHFHALLFDLLFHVVIIICLSPPCLDIVNLRFESGSIRIPSSFSLSPLFCLLYLYPTSLPFKLPLMYTSSFSTLSRPLPKTRIQLKKRKPISETSSFSGNFCKNACLFSFHDSPDVKKSPLWSPAKSPRKNSNAIFLHIPARTAAMLLEAALRIQKQSSPKPKAQNKNVGFGIFGSIMKRLTQRNRNRKREIEGDGLRVSVKDILSSVWSESNEEKSLDMETSSSSQSEVSAEIIDFVSKERQNGDFASCEKDFCTSPFRFVLQRSPSSGRHTPNFSSPATSPGRHRSQDKENNYEGESLIEEEEEEKEQFSPVSILDPPFEDDDDGHEGDDDGDDDGSFDLECSYAIVQRAKQQLLHKLRRFEKLAELDPIELEKRMLEGLDDDNNDAAQWDAESEDCVDDDESIASDREKKVDDFVREVLNKSGFHHFQGIPQDMKRLVSDLIAQEEREQQCSRSREVVVERVCKRLESWTEVESNTIDMMVELDFRRELSGWSKNQEQVDEAAIEIELAIFGLLVEEVSEELVCLKGI